MDTIAHHYYFKEILIILAIAAIIVPLFQRVRISPILCYLVTGIIIGPFGLASLTPLFPALDYVSISDSGWVKDVAEFGVMLLLFMIGLELSVNRLWDLRHKVFGLGGLQILLCTAAISFIARSFGNSLEVSILVGASLALSSTATVMQLLKERGNIASETGTTSFSILLMQDMAVVPILMLLAVFAGAESESDMNTIAHAIGQTLGQAILMIMAIFIIGRTFLRPLLHYFSSAASSEWILAIALLIAIGTSALTYSVGLSLALGAFLAGLLIAETEFRHEVELVIEPLKSVFMGIFFLSIGMMIDIRAVMESPVWIPLSVAGIFAIKAAVTMPLAIMFRVSLPSALESALLLGQGGEFAFLIVGMALGFGLIPQGDAQFFLLVTALTMILTPAVASFAGWGKATLDRFQHRNETKDTAQQSDVEPYILVVGFGRVGSMLASIFSELSLPYKGVENNSQLVGHAKRDGHEMIYGDARRSAFWDGMKLDQLRAVIITVDNPKVAEHILRAIRKRAPLLPVMVRARHETDVTHLYDLGANLALPEMLESSLVMARHVLHELQLPEDSIRSVIDTHREKKRTDAVNKKVIRS